MRLPRRLTNLLFLTALAVQSGCADEPAPEPAAFEPAPEMDTLVTADWLKEHLGDPDLVVLDEAQRIKNPRTKAARAVRGRGEWWRPCRPCE